MYPKGLYDLKNPPFVLFYLGNIGLLQGPCVSVIGSRNPSEYSSTQTKKVVEVLKKEYCIVSGLAKGIDGIAHRAALDYSTVGVLGCGIDIVYPMENIRLFKEMGKNHCIVSEYPPGITPKKYFFPFRNRIIAALSPKIYVMSASVKSGTMTTVNEALELNRHVICLPHPIDDITGLGCNLLIKDGADVLTSVNEI